jgi:hypothetical protein
MRIYAMRSRFLPDTILDRFDLKSAPARDQARRPVKPIHATIDLKSTLRGVWS